MKGQKTFGRRTTPQPLRVKPRRDAPALDVAPVFAGTSAAELARLHKEIVSPSANNEWREREQPAERKFKVPWRQVALMASLCFGIASFVLPDTINDDLDWLLYGLMAISAYVGLSNRFIKS